MYGGLCSKNSYYQYFSGEKIFAAGAPCEASELVHFRHRIGEKGIVLILKESIRVNGKDSEDPRVSVDTTVQKKNITFPTNDKLYKKMIKKVPFHIRAGAATGRAKLHADNKKATAPTTFP